MNLGSEEYLLCVMCAEFERQFYLKYSKHNFAVDAAAYIHG